MSFGNLYPKTNWMKKEDVGSEGAVVTVQPGQSISTFEDEKTEQVNKYLVINVEHNNQEYQLRLNKTSYENILAKLRKEREDPKFELDENNYDETMVGRKLHLIVVNGTPSYILVQKVEAKQW